MGRGARTQVPPRFPGAAWPPPGPGPPGPGSPTEGPARGGVLPPAALAGDSGSKGERDGVPHENLATGSCGKNRALKRKSTYVDHCSRVALNFVVKHTLGQISNVTRQFWLSG